MNLEVMNDIDLEAFFKSLSAAFGNQYTISVLFLPLAISLFALTWRKLTSAKSNESQISEGMLKQPFAIFLILSLALMSMVVGLLPLLDYALPKGYSEPSSGSASLSTILGVPVALSGSLVALLLAKRSVDDARNANELATAQAALEQIQHLATKMDDALKLFADLEEQISSLRNICYSFGFQTLNTYRKRKLNDQEILKCMDEAHSKLREIKSLLQLIYVNPITLRAWDIERQKHVDLRDSYKPSLTNKTKKETGFSLSTSRQAGRSHLLTTIENTQSIIDFYELRLRTGYPMDFVFRKILPVLFAEKFSKRLGQITKEHRISWFTSSKEELRELFFFGLKNGDAEELTEEQSILIEQVNEGFSQWGFFRKNLNPFSFLLPVIEVKSLRIHDINMPSKINFLGCIWITDVLSGIPNVDSLVDAVKKVSTEEATSASTALHAKISSSSAFRTNKLDVNLPLISDEQIRSLLVGRDPSRLFKRFKNFSGSDFERALPFDNVDAMFDTWRKLLSKST